MLAHPANPMDLYIGEAPLRLQLSLAVNPISVYPNMIYTPLWLHTSVGGFHPVYTDGQVMRLFYFFSTPKQQLKQICKGLRILQR